MCTHFASLFFLNEHVFNQISSFFYRINSRLSNFSRKTVFANFVTACLVGDLNLRQEFGNSIAVSDDFSLNLDHSFDFSIKILAQTSEEAPNFVS